MGVGSSGLGPQVKFMILKIDENMNWQCRFYERDELAFLEKLGYDFVNC
jgi:hypothetical protein